MQLNHDTLTPLLSELDDISKAKSDEALLQYVSRVYSTCNGSTIGEIPSSIELVQYLLPLHTQVMKVLLREFRRDYMTTLKSILYYGHNHEFWLVSRNLHMIAHFEPELIYICRESLRQTLGDCLEDYLMIEGEYRQRFLHQLSALQVPEFLLSRWVEKLMMVVLEVYVEEKSIRIFDYILDYPESKGDISRLHDVLQRPESRLYTRSLSCIEDAFRRRLLQGGVESVDIVSQLALSVDPLRHLDHTGFILDRIALKVRAYLAQRHDGLEAILSVFLNLSMESEYSNILRECPEIILDTIDGVSFELLPDNYTMDPPEAIDHQVRISSKIGTVFDILANLFEDPNNFVIQYQRQLMNKLIDGSGSLSNTYAQLEVLKAKFPSLSWSSCDVMLRDYEGSTKKRPKGITSLLVISHLYWPVNDDNFNSPTPTPELLKIAKDYSVTHRQQELKWRRELSRVHIEVQFNDGPENFSCTIEQATLLTEIDKHEGCSLKIDNLITTLAGQMSSAKVIEAAEFWVRRRVLRVNDCEMIVLAESLDSIPDYCDASISMYRKGL